MTTVESIARLSCTENATLLSTITNVPGDDVGNVLRGDKNTKDGGFLTLGQEMALTKALARLSGITKDPNHITAVCVEQKLEPPELTVRVAINKANPNDGQGILGRILGGFDGIFLLLVKLSNDHQDIKLVRSQVLRGIISLCHHIILERLGSSTAEAPRTNRKKKPCLSKTLHNTIAGLRKAGAQTQHPASVDQLEKLESLIQDHEECGDFQRQSCLLENILMRCKSLIKTTSLDELLSILPNTTLAPTLKSSLARRIAKLGQYADISKQLCLLALKVPALAAMRASPVMLPPETFRNNFPASYQPDLSTAFARSVEKTNGISTTLDDICKKLDTTRQQASRKFAKDVRGINRDGKCHAEVQILFQYEMCPCRPAPRIVASSKSACYLCNALFRVHGRYHIPRTHGRLYRGWKLPAVNLTNMEGVEAELANALERDIGKCLRSLLNGSLKSHFPNESTLSIEPTSSLSTVTTNTVPMSPTPVLEMTQRGPAQSNNSKEIVAMGGCDHLDTSDEPHPTGSVARAAQVERGHGLVSHSDAKEGPSRDHAFSKTSKSSNKVASGDSDHTLITLQQGKPRTIILHPRHPSIVCTRDLNIHIEWSSMSMGRGSPEGSCIALVAELLSVEDADKYKSAQAIHDTRNLSTEFETECSGNGDVLLGSGDELIKIRRTEN